MNNTIVNTTELNKPVIIMSPSPDRFINWLGENKIGVLKL
jgi:hypothetical protein